MQDLPVAIDVEGHLGAELASWAESVGWQVVAPGGGLRPALVLTAVPIPGAVLVVDGSPTADQVREALQAGAVDVVGWPADRERLRRVPEQRARSAAPTAGGRTRRLTVAGTGGGVGTSTVALAIGGLLAWGGRDAVVVGGEDLLVLCGLDPWRGPGTGELSLLDPEGSAAEVPHLARPVPGVPGLRVLGGGADPSLPTSRWPCDVVVLDRRTAGPADADLVCARPDIHLAAAAPAPERVLLVGDGPLDPGRVRAAIGAAPAGHLPRSARVARAGAAGRVPSGLPGTWLRELRAAVGRVLG